MGVVLPGVARGGRGGAGVAGRDGATDAAREADGRMRASVDGRTIDQPNNAVSIAASESSCSDESSTKYTLSTSGNEEAVTDIGSLLLL